MVFNDSTLVTFRNHLHAPAFTACFTEGDPDGDAFLGIDASVGRILMPTDERRRMWFLDEEHGSCEQQVRPQQIFYHVQDYRVMSDFVEKLQTVVGIVAVFCMEFFRTFLF